MLATRSPMAVPDFQEPPLTWRIMFTEIHLIAQIPHRPSETANLPSWHERRKIQLLAGAAKPVI